MEPRIVLHRARAWREEAQVDSVILAAEARIVAHRLRLGQARQSDVATALQSAETALPLRRSGEVDAGAAACVHFENQRLLAHERAIASPGVHPPLRAFRAGVAPFSVHAITPPH